MTDSRPEMWRFKNAIRSANNTLLAQQNGGELQDWQSRIAGPPVAKGLNDLYVKEHDYAITIARTPQEEK